MNRRKSPWYLATGFVLGLLLGLFYGYQIAPIEHSDTYPVNLPAAELDAYRVNIALAYQADGDLGRAQTRLGLIGDTDPSAALQQQAQALFAAGDPHGESSALAELALDLGSIPLLDSTAQPTEAAAVEISEAAPSSTPQPAPEIRNSTSTPVVTPTALPSRTPTATPGSAFQLVEFELICDPALTQPLLQVFTYDASRRPVPGVEIIILWADQTDHFFTGLKPEISLGYADFELEIGVNYTVQLIDGGEPVQGITPSECETDDGERYWGSLTLAFQQP